MREVDEFSYVNATRIIMGIDSLILVEFAALRHHLKGLVIDQSDSSNTVVSLLSKEPKY